MRLTGESAIRGLANEFARSFLQKYAPQRLPPQQMELSLSA